MNRMALLSLACRVLLATQLAGCTVGPDFQRPAPPAVKHYTTTPVAGTLGTGGDAQRIVAGADLPAQWWQLFHSPQLDALVRQALAANPGVAAAQASLRQAQEALAAGNGSRFPVVTADTNASRQRVAGSLASPAASGATYYTLRTAQLEVNWAPDLFGGTRRQLETLRAQVDMQRYQLEAARLSLTANVVIAAIDQASLRAQIDATHAIIAGQQRTLGSMQRQFALGQLAEADVAAQRTALAQAAAALPPLEKQLNQENDALAALLGVAPAEAKLPAFDLADLHLPAALPLSLPARLVAHQPDVRAAEAQWHAANAQLGVAVADRLPRFTITADAGSSATRFGQLLHAGSGFWSLAGDLAQPVFDAGSLRHQERAASAARDAAAAQYQTAVVGALQNVADALYALQGDAETLAAAREAEHAAAHGLAISQHALALGATDQVALWQAQQAWQQARIAAVQAAAARYGDTVALFQSLGGGWWHADVAAAGKRATIAPATSNGTPHD